MDAKEYSRIADEALEMQRYLEITCSDNPVEVVERLKQLNVYQARAGYLLAKSKAIYNSKRSSEIAIIVVEIAKQNFLSAKAQNALVDSIAGDEGFLVDWLDRICAAIVHQQDVLRSILSYEKENLRLNNTGY